MAQTILIIGASRGIGQEMARQAGARGDHVIATVRQVGAAADLGGIAGQVVQADVTDAPSLARAAREIAKPINLLVVNAGVYRGRGGMDAADLESDAWSETLMTNVAGPFFAVRAMLPKMKTPGGKVAIISSRMGSSRAAAGDGLVYRASKAAATNLACNLATALAPQGIAVGSYHPGWVRTDMGGSNADVSVEDSAAGLLARFDVLSPATSGVFEDYRGETIAF